MRLSGFKLLGYVTIDYRVRRSAGLFIPGRDINFMPCSAFIGVLRSLNSALNSFLYIVVVYEFIYSFSTFRDNYKSDSRYSFMVNLNCTDMMIIIKHYKNLLFNYH